MIDREKARIVWGPTAPNMMNSVFLLPAHSPSLFFKERIEAAQDRNFSEADRIRDDLRDRGVGGDLRRKQGSHPLLPSTISYHLLP